MIVFAADDLYNIRARVYYNENIRTIKQMAMKKIYFTFLTLLLLVANIALAVEVEVLPSWNNTEAKKTIVQFVEQVTEPGGKHFVPVEERIAVFDNDGTLWSEQPVYTQLLFAIDRIKKLAPQHPEWKTKEPFASLLKGDIKKALSGGQHAIAEILMVTHAGMSTADFEKTVKDWIATAKHPKTKQPFTKMVYQPMLELLAYLRENGFKTYIVSGGGIEFIRPWSEAIYGIPPEQVIGSSIKTEYVIQNGTPVLMRLPQISFVDDKEGKPIGINSHIGRRPIAAFGNSDGDREMLEWTQGGNSAKGVRLMMLVHHDDAKREWAYGANSKIGTFSDSLMKEAKKNGWVVISIKNDWKQVFPFEDEKK